MVLFGFVLRKEIFMTGFLQGSLQGSDTALSLLHFLLLGQMSMVK